MNRTYISTTDTAKLIRQTLKVEFPSVNFGVRSKSYSGGSSITIRWVDGPTEADVQPYVNMFAGASFDGMQDLKEYHDIVNEDGERIHYGADFIFCTRDYSAEFTQRIMERVCAFWHIAPLKMDNFGWFTCPPEGENLLGRDSIINLINNARRILRGDFTPQLERVPSWISTMLEQPAESPTPVVEQPAVIEETPAPALDPIRQRLQVIDIDNLTPMQALAILAELKAAA